MAKPIEVVIPQFETAEEAELYLDVRNKLRDKDVTNAYDYYADIKDEIYENCGDGAISYADPEDKPELQQMRDKLDRKLNVISTAFSNFGFDITKLDKDQARLCSDAQSNKTNFLDQYYEACKDYDKYNFFQWIASLFVDNDCAKARARRNHLFDAIKQSNILAEGVKCTKGTLSHYSSLTSDNILDNDDTNFNNARKAEHDAFLNVGKNYLNLEGISGEYTNYINSKLGLENKLDVVDHLKNPFNKFKLQQEAKKINENEVDASNNLDGNKDNIEIHENENNEQQANEEEIKEFNDKNSNSNNLDNIPVNNNDD